MDPSLTAYALQLPDTSTLAQDMKGTQTTHAYIRAHTLKHTHTHTHTRIHVGLHEHDHI